MLGLEWGRVDLENNLLYLHEDNQKNGQLSSVSLNNLARRRYFPAPIFVLYGARDPCGFSRTQMGRSCAPSAEVFAAHAQGRGYLTSTPTTSGTLARPGWCGAGCRYGKWPSSFVIPTFE